MGEFDIETAVKRLIDERDVLYVASDTEDAVDAKDWVRVRSHFAHEVTIDLAPDGAPARTIAADDFVRDVAAANFAEKKSFHGRFNPRVTISGDQAELVSPFYAWNQYTPVSPDLWEVWGQFRYGLRRTERGWKIVFLKQIRYFQRGDPAVGAALGPTG